MPTLDLRDMPPPERHPAVYAALNSLAPGAVLELVNDHKPSPLRYEIEATGRTSVSPSSLVAVAERVTVVGRSGTVPAESGRR